MCKKDGESVDHLLLHCEWPMLCGAIFLAGLVFLGSCLVVFWIYVLVGVPLAGLGVPWFGRWCLFVFFWSIWRERNNRCFEDLESSMEEILASLLYSLYSWTAAYLFPLSLSYADFLSHFSFSS
jgi:hypothetical protein